MAGILQRLDLLIELLGGEGLADGRAQAAAEGAVLAVVDAIVVFC